MKTFMRLTAVVFLGLFLLVLVGADSDENAFEDVLANKGIAGETCLVVEDPFGSEHYLGPETAKSSVLERAKRRPFVVFGKIFGQRLIDLKPVWIGRPVASEEYQIPHSEVVDLKSLNRANANHLGHYEIDTTNSQNGTILARLRNQDFVVEDEGIIKGDRVFQDYVVGSKPTDIHYQGVLATNAYSVIYNARKDIVNAGGDVHFTQTIINSDIKCNALYFTYINRTRSGKETSDCANPAYSTVLAHEYGHSVVDTYAPYCYYCNFTDLFGFHEGYADTISGVIMETDCIGDEFFGRGSGCLRNISEVWVYPVNSQSSHDRGRPISGTFWDIYEEIEKEKTLQLIVYTLQENNENRYPLRNRGYEPEVIRELLIEGDAKFNDGENRVLIEQALDRHGL